MATVDATRETIVLPDDHFKTRIKHQYNDIPLAIAREILQNSQDAGADRVEFTLSPNEFIAVDNGKGMTLDEFREFYLTLGGSKKDSGSIGGFGAAKELLSFAWDNWTCKGQGFVMRGHGASDPESQADNTLTKGFAVAASDEEIEGDIIRSRLTHLVAMSDLSLTVSVNGYDLQDGRKLRKNQIVQQYAWGTLYVHKSKPAYGEETGYLYIRTKGLYTASEYVGGDYVFYLDLTVASPAVLTENRDGLRYEAKTRIQQDLLALIRNPRKMETISKSKITVYGEYCSSNEIYNQERGTFDVDSNLSDWYWRKPFVIAEEDTKANAINGDIIRPKYAKALEIWSGTLNMVADLAGLDRPMPGLYFGNEANAIHTCLRGHGHIIAANVERILTDDPFSLLELAIHEFAHYERGDHSQRYEMERMTIARKIGVNSLAIMNTISRLQQEPATRGRYWEM